MADKHNRFSDNAPGSWYVDNTCIDCDLCGVTAPETFRRSDEHDHHMVFRQPVSAEDLSAAERAREGCPVDAIGNDAAS